MFECLDTVLFEIFSYKTPRLKAKHQAEGRVKKTAMERWKEIMPKNEGQELTPANISCTSWVMTARNPASPM